MERTYPFVSHLGGRNFEVDKYLSHINCLNINPGKNNLVIGPSTWLFELAAIESAGKRIPDMESPISLITIQNYTSLQRGLSNTFRGFYPNLPLNLIENELFQRHLSSKPSARYDCIIFTGAHPSTLEPKDVSLILKSLKPGGVFYSTINNNSLNPNYPKANQVFYDIPTNPTYPYPPGYIGAVWKR